MRDEARFLVADADGHTPPVGALPVDALSLGLGVFETVLIIEGEPVLRAEHQERLERSCEALGIATAQRAAALFSRAEGFAREAALPRARLRIAVFAGGPRCCEAPNPLALIALRAAGLQAAPLTLTVPSLRRQAGDVTAVHKTTSYLGNAAARDAALAAGFDDALFLDTSGCIAETTTSNIFLSIGRRIVTPSTGALLPGVARAWVIRMALSMGMPVEERPVSAGDLAGVEGAFVTNSIIGLVPVSRVDAFFFADPGGGPAFEALAAAWRQMTHTTG